MNHETMSQRLVDCDVSTEAILWGAGQLANPNKDAWEDLLYDPVAFQKMVGFKVLDDHLDDIEELIAMLFDHNKLGFFVKLSKQIPRNIKFNEDGSHRSWKVGNCWRTKWVYVESLDDLPPIAESFADDVMANAIAKAKGKAEGDKE